MGDVLAQLALPVWARVGDRRRAHIARVTARLGDWAATLRLQEGERRAWLDAGLWHDALRDATLEELRAIVPDFPLPDGALHGPAAAARLVDDGEKRTDVLEAIRWHTSGHAEWNRTGRALYMADFLEPGRGFMPRDRDFLAHQVPHDFDGVFRQVVRLRLEWNLHEGHGLLLQSVALWNRVR